ncbi:MAG TPA: UDP-N-acetylmuramate dehydrogenase [Candidatus Competibacteraceae bacterium]|nr:UDP-N-acetylmuramate dehydrogenase [Candidatus Competibacteraceae bacterium]
MDLHFDHSLRALNTFGVEARAAVFASLHEAGELAELLALPELRGLPRLWLGGGSNVLFTRDFPGLVVRVALCGRALLGEDEAAWYVAAAAGENWHELVCWTLEQGWGGLENLALIPGTVGAAPIQNIGAYGVELRQRLAWLEALDTQSGHTLRFDNADCRFAYRHSLFKELPRDRYLITRVVLRLPREPELHLDYGEVRAELEGCKRLTPRDVAEAVMRIRRRKLPDPAVLGNAGSFFKNPIVPAALVEALRAEYPEIPCYPAGEGRVKLAAGWLIERAGWKGRRQGAAGMYEKQALVLVNHGGATGTQLWELAQMVQASVRERFGVELEPEPLVV